MKRSAPWAWAGGADPSSRPHGVQTPGMQFVQELIRPYLAGEISARRVCILSYFASQAGIAEATPYALPPTSATGHFQRKLDGALALEVDDHRLYKLAVPMSSRGNDRGVVTVSTLPPHECLHREVKDHPEVLATWTEHINQKTWVECYERHSLVASASREDVCRILPLAIYMDASEFEKRDSVLICSVRFVHSSFRHVAFAIRKNDFCDCGCGGWDTVFSLFTMLRWSLQSLINGTFPHHRHDSQTWQQEDADRAEKAGSELGFRAIVLDIVGDWSEIAHRWGLPSWASKESPCFRCFLKKSELDSTSPSTWRWKTSEDYHRYCAACEVWVSIPDAGTHRLIRFALEAQEHKKGMVMTQAVQVGQVWLYPDDRLEPTAAMPDTAEFMRLQAFPARVCFWRSTKPVLASHRHPLLCQELDLGPPSIGIDILHTVHLGVLQEYIARVIWLCITVDVFNTRSPRQAERTQETLKIIVAGLKSWYPEYERMLGEDMSKTVTRVGCLKPSMIGTMQKPKLKLKASESRHFLPYILKLVRDFQGQLWTAIDVASLLAAGEALETWMKTIGMQPRVVSHAACCELQSLAIQHVRLAKHCGVAIKPKHHLFLEATLAIPFKGNPRMFQCYFDESLNDVLTTIAASCHRVTFERRLLAKFHRGQTHSILAERLWQ